MFCMIFKYRIFIHDRIDIRNGNQDFDLTSLRRLGN